MIHRLFDSPWWIDTQATREAYQCGLIRGLAIGAMVVGVIWIIKGVF